MILSINEVVDSVVVWWGETLERCRISAQYSQRIVATTDFVYVFVMNLRQFYE